LLYLLFIKWHNKCSMCKTTDFWYTKASSFSALYIIFFHFYKDPDQYTRGCINSAQVGVTYGVDKCIEYVDGEGCYCFNDLCNSSPIFKPTVFLTLVAFMATFCNFNFWSIENGLLRFALKIRQNKSFSFLNVYSFHWPFGKFSLIF
jgi:hypothetical protein